MLFNISKEQNVWCSLDDKLGALIKLIDWYFLREIDKQSFLTLVTLKIPKLLVPKTGG